MKRIWLLLLFFGLLRLPLLAQVKVGDLAPDIVFPQVLNGSGSIIKISDLKGKLVLLEFWATWCGPCVQAMPHLQDLQKQFKGQLQVVTITEEPAQRIHKYLKNKPSNLLFAVADTGTTAAKQAFPYRLFPHAALLSPQGTVVAITEPKHITEQIIRKVLAGESIDLPFKQDNLLEDPLVHFAVPEDTQQLFVVQPEINGVGGRSHSYRTNPSFKGRRLTLINLPLKSVYRLAFNNIPYGRTLDIASAAKVQENKANYCIDIIVPRGQEKLLLPTLREELKSRFDLTASLEKRLRPVYVLQIADNTKVKQLPISKVEAEVFSAHAGVFHGKRVPLAKIADYLESFGMVNLPVIDETCSKALYDISFEFEPERKDAITEALAKLGLKLVKVEREIEMLVFR